MKQSLALFILLTAQLCFANMASPIRKGTFSSAAFSSSDVDIRKEKILVAIDKDFKTAAYTIEYFISTDTDGTQIPLLFYAIDYEGDFKVTVDDSDVKVTDVPSEYRVATYSPFKGFANSIKLPTPGNEGESATIFWSDDSGFEYHLSDLKFFETRLAKGAHTIRVTYSANVWADVSGWISAYSFRYSLSPAQYWKSFGTLEIMVDATKSGKSFTTNLGPQQTGKLDSVASWTFQKLPAGYFLINYVPATTPLAKVMMAIGPAWLTILFALMLASLHLYFVLKFKKSNAQKKQSWVMITGSLLVPLLILLFYIFSFDFIDAAIGPDAGRYHGYVFFTIVLYPLFLPLYWLTMWLAVKIIDNK